MKKLKKVLLLLLIAASVSFLAFGATENTQAASMKLNKKSITLYVGATKKLKVSGTKKKIKWISSKKSVASVSSSGKVTAKKKGSATITAKIGKTNLKCKVTVKKKATAGNDVWIPRTGSKYHRTSTCSNMKKPSKVSLKEAKNMGYTPCKKCYH